MKARYRTMITSAGIRIYDHKEFDIVKAGDKFFLTRNPDTAWSICKELNEKHEQEVANNA